MPKDPKELKPGEGAVVHVGGEDLAVFNDGGELRAASAICTHAKCTVEWNDANLSFDCPCHGSRFASDFTVMQGPAKVPLEPRDLPAS